LGAGGGRALARGGAGRWRVPGVPPFALWAAAGGWRCGGAAVGLAGAGGSRRKRRSSGGLLLRRARGAAHALYLRAALAGDYVALMRYFNTGLLVMAVLTLLIARRVLPFFAKRAVQGLEIAPPTRSGPWQPGAGVLALAGQPAGAAGPGPLAPPV
ncbi:NnrS family protein, partial [Achromobacter ruhlandii]|uniref:NnrS family protein n=1 Tax=Achromobacter ruhlandii TaxID=72557 RepID=UPI00201610DE